MDIQLERWIAAHSALKLASSDFLRTCHELEAAISSHSSSIACNQNTLETVLDTIRPSLDPIAPIKAELYDARVSLNRLHNLSTSRVPISRLPPETLGHIFSLATCPSPFEERKSSLYIAVNLSQVCAKWRQVAIDVPTLWSHIDTWPEEIAAIQTDAFKLQLERCRGTPIYLYLDLQWRRLSHGTIVQALLALHPHLQLVHSLAVRGFTTDADLCNFIFKLLPAYDGSNNLRAVDICLIGCVESQEEQFAWPTESLQGLFELSLSCLTDKTYPSFKTMSTILSNSPLLHTLRLKSLGILQVPTSENIELLLPCLQLLELDDVFNDTIVPFISALVPGQLELKVRLGINYNIEPNVLKAVRGLLGRSNVIALTMDALLRPATVFSLLASVSNLRFLFIKALGTREILNLWDFVEAQFTCQYPELQTLCFFGGLIDSSNVGQIARLIVDRGLRAVVFLGCSYSNKFWPPDSIKAAESIDPKVMIATMPITMMEWLSARVEKVVVRGMKPDPSCSNTESLVEDLISLA